MVSTFFAATCLSIPEITANMKLLIPIRERLNDLLSTNDISESQYSFIVTSANNDILDADFKDHDMNYKPSLNESLSEYFRLWVDQEEYKGRMTEDTSDLIRNIFGLGYAPNRPGDKASSRQTVVKADYKGNGMFDS